MSQLNDSNYEILVDLTVHVNIRFVEFKTKEGFIYEYNSEYGRSFQIPDLENKALFLDNTLSAIKNFYSGFPGSLLPYSRDHEDEKVKLHFTLTYNSGNSYYVARKIREFYSDFVSLSESDLESLENLISISLNYFNSRRIKTYSNALYR